MSSLQAQRIAHRYAGTVVKTAREQAEYWFEPTKVKNVSVKEYESADRGNSSRQGEFMMAGKLHIQPKGAVWDVVLDVSGKWSLNEHDRSGTLAFHAENSAPENRLTEMSLDYDTEDAIMRLLGKVDFVPYEEPERRKSNAWQEAARILSKYTGTPSEQGRAEMSDWAVNTLRENYNRSDMEKMFREEMRNARGLKPDVDGLKKFLAKPSSITDVEARAAIFLQLVAKGVI